jgi:hypothetical protein
MFMQTLLQSFQFPCLVLQRLARVDTRGRQVGASKVTQSPRPPTLKQRSPEETLRLEDNRAVQSQHLFDNKGIKNSF